MEIATSPLHNFTALYAGSIIVLKGLKSVDLLVRHTRGKLEKELGANPPGSTQNPEFVPTCKKICDDFLEDPVVETLWKQILREAIDVHHGVEGLHWDKYKLRVQPTSVLKKTWSTQSLLSKNPTLSELPLHRDTWGSGVDAQLNWWLPIFPLEPGRTLELYPSLFNTKVENTSASWKVSEFSKWRKALDPTTMDNENERYTYPSLPCATPEAIEKIEASGCEGVPVVIECGDVAVFSAAHLHRSVPNTTTLARFSTEVRTIFQPDVIAHRGAVNIDTHTSSSKLHWFSPIGPS